MRRSVMWRHAKPAPSVNDNNNVRCAYGRSDRTHEAPSTSTCSRFHDRSSSIRINRRGCNDRYLQSDRSAFGNERFTVLRGDDRPSRAYGSGYSALGSAVVTRWGAAYRRALTTKALHRSEGPYRVSSRSLEFRGSDLETVFERFGLASGSLARTRCDFYRSPEASQRRCFS